MSLNILYETHMKVIEQEHKISQQVGGGPATLSHKTDEKWKKKQQLKWSQYRTISYVSAL